MGAVGRARFAHQSRVVCPAAAQQHRGLFVIGNILKACPDFTLTFPEYAAAGDFHFVRWIASGSGSGGRFQFTGCDRRRTRGGLVCENYIFCDDPFFARVAAI